MKNKLKGMTLVELVVAIAILGLSSTMLVTSFAAVSMMNRETHQFNERMNTQIKSAENAVSSGTDLKSAVNLISMQVMKEGNYDDGFNKKTINQPDCFIANTKVNLTGNSLWVDSKAEKSDTMVAEDIDFKYYNVLDPLPQPASTP